MGRHPMWKALRQRLTLAEMGSDPEAPAPSRAEVRTTLERAFRPILARGTQVLPCGWSRTAAQLP